MKNIFKLDTTYKFWRKKMTTEDTINGQTKVNIFIMKAANFLSLWLGEKDETWEKEMKEQVKSTWPFGVFKG